MNQPKSLKDLAELAVQHRGLSGLGLSQLAAKNGIKLTHTTINAIRQGTYKYTPKEETIRALAWLADVSEEVAFTAAGQPVPGPPFAEELPPGVDNLSPKSRKVIIDIARVLVDLEKNADASNAEDPEQPAGVGDQGTEPGHPGAGQKTGERRLSSVRSAGDPSSSSAASKVVFGINDTNLDGPGNIPLPENWQDLAAYSGGSTRHVEREREWQDLGEESQDPEHDK